MTPRKTFLFCGLLAATVWNSPAAPALEPYRVPDEQWEVVRKYYTTKENLTLEQIDLWRDYAVAKDPGPRPEIGNEELAKLGYCDVTSAPFHADPTGSKDSTQAIRDALHYARSYRLALFFPPGDYAVSDMLHCAQGLVIGDGQMNSGELRPVGAPVVMVGSTKDPNKRARIILKANSPGYQDPAKPKYIVLISRPDGPNPKGHTPTSYDSATTNYDNYFGSIDIVAEEGNPGAIGLRMRGAEGTGIMDVTIDFRKSGLTGMQALAGSGGSHHKITVLGGQIGISSADWLPGMPYDNSKAGTQPGPTLSSIRLEGQSEWAMIVNTRGALVVVGADIKTDKSGPVIQLNRSGAVFDGCLAMIDSKISYSRPDILNSVVLPERSFYLRNVFVENGGDLGKTIQAGPGWVHFAEVAVAKEPKRYGAAKDAAEPIWIDGKPLGKDEYVVLGDQKTPPDDLVTRHGWGDSPTFETAGAFNVRDGGAIGDGEADDTAALQSAIDKHDLIFLPKGEYKIRNTLKLRPNTKLFGVHPVYSGIYAANNKKDGPFAGGDLQNGDPAVETANDVNAETYLGFLAIRTDAIWSGHDTKPNSLYTLKWQCGPKSVVRQIAVGPDLRSPWNILQVLERKGFDAKQIRDDKFRYVNIYDAFEVDVAPIKHHPILVTGNGGGKWFNFWFHGYYPYDKHVRLMKIDGTQQRFSVYHLHGQHSHAHAIFEINGAKNIDIYGTKTECHTRFMDLINSSQIRIYGMGGAFGPGADVKGVPQPFYWFRNCEDFLVAAPGQEVSVWKHNHVQVSAGRFPLVKLPMDSYDAILDENAGGVKVDIPRQARPILYQRGNPGGF